MARIVRLTESDLTRLVRRVIREQVDNEYQKQIQDLSDTADNSPEGMAAWDKALSDAKSNLDKYQITSVSKPNKYKNQNEKIIRTIINSIKRDGMTDEKMIHDFYGLLNKVMNRKPSDNIANIWNSFLRRSSLNGVFPTWELLSLLNKPKQNGKAIMRGFQSMGSNPEFIKNIQSLIGSNDYDRTRQTLKMTTLPSSNTINQLISMTLPKQLGI
jgi:hypothetical protein